MLERKIYNKLLEWKNKKDKMSLIVDGARQVGKTYIIEKFGKENYENYVYINFYENPKYSEIFSDSLNANDIEKQMSIRISNANLVPGKTLIFLDEIQECPNAITALKFLTIDGRYDIIASGSLLGISYKQIKSYPVGYVEHYKLNSLDFEEFCWANGVKKETITYLKELYIKKDQVPLSIHNYFLDLFKEYIIVGGMPKVVSDYVQNHNFKKVLELQKGIIDDYIYDIIKYADNTEKTKARNCFLSIPKQLAKENKKFTYSILDNNGSARKYANSIMWLYDAGIINLCYNISKPEFPLEGNAKEDTFKVYMKDTGLLMAMLEEGSQEEVINGNLGIYKGAIYENIIADILSKSGHKLYYFDYNSTLEIDFFIRLNNKVTAIEVKSANNTKSKSLNSVINNWNVEQGIKLSSKNTGITEKITSYPIYMAMFL